MSQELKKVSFVKVPLTGLGLTVAGCLLLLSPLGRGQPGQYGYAPGATPPAVQSALNKYEVAPENAAAALETARFFIYEGRRSGNADIILKADDILSSLSDRDSMAEALKLRAESQYYLHNSDEALKLLNLSLAMRGNDATALLSRANILLSQGKIKEATKACHDLEPTKRLDMGLICEAGAKALGPAPADAAQQLRDLLQSGRVEPDLIGYVHRVLGEIAMFHGQMSRAEEQFKNAQKFDSKNLKIRQLHADSLLALREPEAALKALDIPARSDAFLIRRAIAYKQSGQDEALSHLRKEMDRRIRQNVRINHAGHEREVARYYLHVKNDPVKALKQAKINWQRHREYEDAWILIDAAKSAGKSEEAAPVRSWMAVENVQASGLVDRLPLEKNDIK